MQIIYGSTEGTLIMTEEASEAKGDAIMDAYLGREQIILQSAFYRVVSVRRTPPTPEQPRTLAVTCRWLGKAEGIISAS